MLNKVLSKLTPKKIFHKNKEGVSENTDETIKVEDEEKYDIERVIWTENIVKDLWIYIKNNNILCGIFLSDSKHPFKKKRRLMIFFSYISFLILISSLIANHSIFCTLKHHPHLKAPSESYDDNDDIEKKCVNKITMLSGIMFVLGIIVLHRFIKMITKCAKVGTDADDHKHNYFFQIILSCVGSQFLILISIIALLLLLKGLFVFIKIDEPVIRSLEYTLVITVVSLSYELCHDIYNFFTQRQLEMLAKKIRNAKFDPHADMRGGNKGRNIHVRVGW